MNSSLRTVAATAALFTALAIGSAKAQWKTFEFDTDDQTPILLDGVLTGNTPYLKANGYTSGVAIDFTDWTIVFRYSFGQYDTNGMATIPTSSVSSNTLYWLGATNTFFKPYDKYYFSVFGTHTDGATKTFCTGRMIQRYDPAADTNITYLIGQINMDWWTNNVGAQVSSNTARIVVLETGKVSQVDYDAHVASNTASFAAVETQKLDVATFGSYTGSLASTIAPAWSNVTGKPSVMGTPSNTVTVTWEAVETNNEAVTYQATAVITGKLDTSTFDAYTSTASTASSPAWSNVTGKPSFQFQHDHMDGGWIDQRNDQLPGIRCDDDAFCRNRDDRLYFFRCCGRRKVSEGGRGVCDSARDIELRLCRHHRGGNFQHESCGCSFGREQRLSRRARGSWLGRFGPHRSCKLYRRVRCFGRGDGLCPRSVCHGRTGRQGGCSDNKRHILRRDEQQRDADRRYGRIYFQDELQRQRRDGNQS
jgi:hypothetical protein